MISFGRQVCSHYDQAVQREWLETNGLGGYALSTLCLSSTRRHHGLLVVPTDPPKKRYVLLNRLEEKVIGSGWSHAISCQQYPDTIAPAGAQFLESFSLSPFPTFTYLVEDARIRKTFFLVSGEHTAVIMYELLSGSPVQIEVRPLVSMRLVDTMIKQTGRFDHAVESTEDTLMLSPEAVPALTLKVTSGFFQSHECWYYDLVYAHEHAGIREDLFSPGIFRFSLWPGKNVIIAASTEPHDIKSIDKLYHKEVFIRARISENFSVSGEFACQLLQAADQFVVNGPQSTSIIQGYPWYEESVESSLIALPGLCLVTGRFPEAKELLIKYSSHINQNPQPVDTMLWFFWAIQKYFEHSGDIEFVRQMHAHLMALYMHLRKGKDTACVMDEDGLLVLHPENRKPVGTQALWYNALQFMEEIEIRIGGQRKRYKDLALRVRESFNHTFWNNNSCYLHRSLHQEGRDDAVGPEALLSIGLPYSVLDQKHFNDLLSTAWKRLYTSYGLRSIAPPHILYTGNAREADASYGQVIPPGSVHPRWIGMFITSFCKVYGHQPQNKRQAWEFLEPFRAHLSEFLLGSIGEVFDGDQPHGMHGCPAFACSVGELLRAIVEDAGNPPEEKSLTIADIMESKNK